MKKKKKAFTLVELIASIAIFGLIAVVSVSMISYGFKLSATNRKTYDADVYSKTFFELLRNNRPPDLGAGSRVPEYYIGYGKYDDTTTPHNSKDDIQRLVNDVKGRTNQTTDDYSDEAKRIPTLDKRKGNFVILVKMQWDGKVYSVETWSYDIGKGVFSEIYRKTLIAP